MTTKTMMEKIAGKQQQQQQQQRRRKKNLLDTVKDADGKQR
jgi:hypothetical protein